METEIHTKTQVLPDHLAFDPRNALLDNTSRTDTGDRLPAVVIPKTPDAMRIPNTSERQAPRLAAKRMLWLMGMCVVLAGCDLFGGNEMELGGPCTLAEHPAFNGVHRFRDFGCEEGYFIYMADMRKVPWTRNRNFISVEFHEAVSEEALKAILHEYDLYYQSRVYTTKHVFARVKSKPAETYYTTYGDTTLPRLGNRPEVKYVLPVYMSDLWQPLMLSDRILITIKDHVSIEEGLVLLDSLIASDHLVRLPMIEPPYLLQMAKATPKDPLSLVNHYMETIDSIYSASVDYAFEIIFSNINHNQ